jgi:hypothetical protein
LISKHVRSCADEKVRCHIANTFFFQEHKPVLPVGLLFIWTNCIHRIVLKYDKSRIASRIVYIQQSALEVCANVLAFGNVWDPAVR